MHWTLKPSYRNVLGNHASFNLHGLPTPAAKFLAVLTPDILLKVIHHSYRHHDYVDNARLLSRQKALLFNAERLHLIKVRADSKKTLKWARAQATPKSTNVSGAELECRTHFLSTQLFYFYNSKVVLRADLRKTHVTDNLSNR